MQRNKVPSLLPDFSQGAHATRTSLLASEKKNSYELLHFPFAHHYTLSATHTLIHFDQYLGTISFPLPLTAMSSPQRFVQHITHILGFKPVSDPEGEQGLRPPPFLDEQMVEDHVLWL
jgi:hypothetical protein